MTKLTTEDIVGAGLADWRKLAQAIHARYRIPGFTAGAAFVAAVAEASDAANHHPDVKLTYGVVDIALCTHEDGMWVTEKDIAAGQADQRARAGARAHSRAGAG